MAQIGPLADIVHSKYSSVYIHISSVENSQLLAVGRVQPLADPCQRFSHS